MPKEQRRGVVVNVAEAGTWQSGVFARTWNTPRTMTATQRGSKDGYSLDSGD